jgi:3-oxoacyl-[acyl-carrier protein] reductase
MSEQTDRIIVVTGGSKGIGRAVCEAFAGPGTRVFFNYATDAAGAEETERRIAEAGGVGSGAQVDVSSESDVTSFLDGVIKEAGRLDVLVNNAGVTRDGLIVRMKSSDWDVVMDVNLKGAFHASKIAAKAMLRQRCGRIINISSVVGASGNPGQANYVSAKAGLIGLTKALAKELASRGITVNAVAPGYVETDMTAAMTEAQREAMVAQIPLGRAGTSREIASAVRFLASEEASYITGHVLHVNGGMYM